MELDQFMACVVDISEFIATYGGGRNLAAVWLCGVARKEKRRVNMRDV